ncbi:MAG: hypothetical protein L3V56_06980 [Candidatus Magnetoovum sp. WYHC-5]|nr:hypothetical protein [Candidatus Magnetoovum sp. WYHC-5]
MVGEVSNSGNLILNRITQPDTTNTIDFKQIFKAVTPDDESIVNISEKALSKINLYGGVVGFIDASLTASLSDTLKNIATETDTSSISDSSTEEELSASQTEDTTETSSLSESDTEEESLSSTSSTDLSYSDSVLYASIVSTPSTLYSSALQDFNLLSLQPSNTDTQSNYLNSTYFSVDKWLTSSNSNEESTLTAVLSFSKSATVNNAFKSYAFFSNSESSSSYATTINIAA